MIIRKARVQDLEKLAVLFDNYRVFYHKESDLGGSKVFLEERILKKESEIFICENEEGTFTGFVQLYPIFSSTNLKKMWLLNDLYVEKAFRGQKIAIGLIEEAKKLCVISNAIGLILETAKSNMEGNQLYPKTGFVLDVEHNYYSWEVS